MKKFSIIHIPLLSFFSKDLYQDVGLYWKGLNFTYLLLLLAVCLIPTMIKAHIAFSNFIDNDAPKVVEQVPEITITDGEVSIKEPQPYYITNPENGHILAILDTTDTINSLEDTDALCLVTKNSVIYRKDKFQTQTIDLTKVENFALDSARITGWLNTTKKFFVITIYPFALLGSYCYRIVQALIYAAIGLLFAYWCKATLSYKTLIRLAIVAVTPCIIVGTVLGLVGVYLPPLVYLLVALAYLFFAVKANSQTMPPQEQIQAEVRDESSVSKVRDFKEFQNLCL
ncbi:MAG: DUF1189 family protein [Planctomycetota bacterium]|nr:MAG: DUF1189 family protein [Planctomycetota bacterium]